MSSLVREFWRPSKRCQYGVFDATCRAFATTKRPRPSGGQTWDVCAKHAMYLDRLRANIQRNGALLDRLSR